MEKGSWLREFHMPDAVLSIWYVLSLLILKTSMQISINRNLISILEIEKLRIREIYQFSQCQPWVEAGSEHRSMGLKTKICAHPTRWIMKHPLQEKVSITPPHTYSGLQILIQSSRTFTLPNWIRATCGDHVVSSTSCTLEVTIMHPHHAIRGCFLDSSLVRPILPVL